MIKISVPIPPNPTPEMNVNPDKTHTGLKAAMAMQNVKPKSLFNSGADSGEPKKVGNLFDTTGS